MLKKLLIILSVSFSCTAVGDDYWDSVRFHELTPDKKYNISSGTGFYINHNYIMTNAHVVENCKNIAIRGAVYPQLVSLVTKDNKKDLAILYSRTSPKKIPYFRSNYNNIHYNDDLFIAGYPLEHSQTGTFTISNAQVKDIFNKPKDHFTRIEFTDVVKHGNSGGPIIDRNANIVGIVTSEVTYSIKNMLSNTKKVVGQGVGLDGVLSFLEQNQIPYFLKSTYDIITIVQIDKVIQDYLVNIHCVIDK